GDGSDSTATVPVPVSGQHVFTALYRGSNSVCGLDASHAAWCWGEHYSYVGGEWKSLSPVDVSQGHQYSDMSGGWAHICGLDAGAAYCWGLNSSGQLGNGSASVTEYHIPVRV